MFQPEKILRLLQGRSALSRPEDKRPTPVSEQRESILFVPVVVTESSARFVLKPAISHGLLRVLPARSVSLLCPTIHPTTNSSEQTPSPRPLSSKSMPPHSDNGTRHTTDRSWVVDVNRRLELSQRSQRRSPSLLRRSRLIASLPKERSSLLWRSSSRLVVFSLSSHPAQVNPDVLMVTSWRVRSWLSTREL